MAWEAVAWRWLTHSALAGLMVLAVGSLAVAVCRQPVQRGRVVLWTLLGSLALPWIGMLPWLPRWPAARFVVWGTAEERAPVRARPGSGPGENLSRSSAMPPPGVDEADPRGSGETDRVERAGTSAHTAGAATARVSAIVWPRLVVAGYAAMTAGLAAWWLLGQVLLWRIHCAARPVPDAISGPAGKRVQLRESDRIRLPLTFTWAKPVILIPTSPATRDDTQALGFGLAHEWSHVEQRDSWAWNFAGLAGCLLFYQPLVWWLRRQLRLCQDYLADDRAASFGSPEDYAAFLVRVARERSIAPILPALGIGDRHSNLFRRVRMLVLDHEPLEHRCRARWNLTIAAMTAAAVAAAAALRLDAAAPPDVASDKAAANPITPAASEEGRTWTGQVVDRATGQPIAEAAVLVRVSLSRDSKTNQWRDLREIHQKTDAEGRYRFTLRREEEAERLLYITLEVEAPDHVNYFGGYGYAMILKNEALGERPFYEKLELAPGKAIEGRLLTPEGEPAAGVKVQSFSSSSVDRPFEDGRFGETWTDAAGRFRLVLHQKGQAVFWLLPQDYVHSTHGLKNDRRGDLGTFTLDRGIRFSGRVLDAQGKPVVGVYLSGGRETRPENDDDVPRGVADMVHRAVITAADGTFTMGPFPPGKYRVVPDEQGWDPSTRVGAKDPERRPLPAVFAPHTVILKEGESPEPVEIRAVPHVVVEAQIYDSKGNNRSGHDVSFVGEIDGGFWSANPHPTADGHFVMLAPHGLENAMIGLMTNEHSCLQFRVTKDAPLSHSRTIRLGTLDRDIKGIEIIRYEAPIILVKATTKAGEPNKGLQVSVNYTKREGNQDGAYILKGGVHSDVNLEAMGGGRFRTSQLAPDREVTVTARADGYTAKSETLTLAEGITREVELILEEQ
jgi:beta-lactamase regulating signal transducer with metallopeptidase domain